MRAKLPVKNTKKKLYKDGKQAIQMLGHFQRKCRNLQRNQFSVRFFQEHAKMKMHSFYFRTTLFLLFWGFLLSSSYGLSSRGALNGRVTDQTGIPLPGVNIIFKGTTLGTTTDANGRFFLSGIPVGKYTVIFSIIGYQPKETVVRILAGQTTLLEVQLQQAAIEAPALIVTASKKKQTIQDSPISVAVVSAKEINLRNTHNLQDALTFVPGVYLINNQLNIRGSTGYSQGAGSRVLVLLDGVPFITGDSGTINWDAIPVTEVDHIEIIKSAGSALYGSNALGGVVNIITKDPSPTPQWHIRTSWGFYDRPYYQEWRWTNRLLQFNTVDASFSRTIRHLGILAAVGRKTSTGYKQNGDYTRWNAFGKIHYRFSPETHLELMTNLAYEIHGQAFLWRGPATNRPFEIFPDAIGDKIHSGKYIWHLTYKTMLRRNLALISKSSLYQTRWQDYFHDNRDFSRTNKWGQEILFEYQPVQRHSVTFGAEGIYHHTHSSIFGNPYTYDLGVYAQDEMALPFHVKLTAGARFDFHQVKNIFHESQLSPKFGLVWQPFPGAAFRTSLGKGFRAAAISEIFTHTLASGFQVLPNLELRAESAKAFEIGWNQFMGKRANFDLAYFQTTYRNMISPELVTYVPPAFHLANLEQARIRGLDTHAGLILIPGLLNTTLNYTYLNAERLGELKPVVCLDDFAHMPNRALPYRPKHIFTGTVSASYATVQLALDYRFMSRFEEVSAYCSDARVPIRVWTARFSAHWKEMKFAFRAQNLTQYYYTEFERNMSAPRNFTFTVEKKF